MKSTFLKVIAIITLIFGILGAITLAGSFALLGSMGLGLGAISALGGVTMGMFTVSLVIGIIDCILMIVGGVIGIRAGNDFTKVGGAKMIGLLMIILAVVSLILSGISGTIQWSNFTSLILPILYCIAAYSFANKAK